MSSETTKMSAPRALHCYQEVRVRAMDFNAVYPAQETDDHKTSVEVKEGYETVAIVTGNGSVRERDEIAATISALPIIMTIVGNAHPSIQEAIERAINNRRSDRWKS